MSEFLSLEGRTALVTGAARGIGKAIAKTLAARGASIVVVDLRMDLAEETAQEITATGRKAIALEADVSNQESVKAMIKAALAKFSKIDILVNNAGITRDGLIMRMKEADFMSVIEANLKSTFIGCREAVKVMSKKRFGSVVNIASIVGETGNAGQTNYAASKGGTIAMTKSFAQEAAPRGIRFNSITPGFIATEMTDVLKDEVKEAFISKIPLGRFGEPREVAEAVAFLLSDHSSYITGETLRVNGGMLM